MHSQFDRSMPLFMNRTDSLENLWVTMALHVHVLLQVLLELCIDGAQLFADVVCMQKIAQHRVFTCVHQLK